MLNEKRFLNDSSIIINIYWSFWQSVKLIVELNFLENLLGYSPTLNSIHRVALLQAGKLLQLLLNQLQEFNQLWPSSNHAKSLLECIIGRILIWCLFCSAQQQTSQPLFIHPVVFINCLRWVTLRKLNQISPPTPCFFFQSVHHHPILCRLEVLMFPASGVRLETDGQRRPRKGFLDRDKRATDGKSHMPPSPFILPAVPWQAVGRFCPGWGG